MNIKHSILVMVGVSSPAWPIVAKASTAPAVAPAIYSAGSEALGFAEPFAWPLAVGVALLLALCVGVLFLLARRDHGGESRRAARQAATAQADCAARADSLLTVRAVTR